MPRPTARPPGIARPALLALAVAALLAQALLPRPAAAQDAGAEADIDALVDDLGIYWEWAFATSSLDYADPAVRLFDTGTDSACGRIEAVLVGAYCVKDATVYFSEPYAANALRNGDDLAWFVVFAHEWGHHVQYLLGISQNPGPAFELQADCLAGAFAGFSVATGAIDQGDLDRAVAMLAVGGDAASVPKDAFGVHGTADQRIVAMMNGYRGGAAVCDVPLAAGTVRAALPPLPADRATAPTPSLPTSEAAPTR